MGVVVALAWFVWMPGYRPALREGERYGVDVSVHQGSIDWKRVAADDVSFAYVKATEGGDHVDGRFEENWEGAAHAGLDRGAYHFFTLCRSGEEQATNFLATVPDAAGALPAALDLELGGNCAQRPARSRVEREVGAFIQRVESATGQRVVMYVGDDWEEIYPTRSSTDRSLWFRRILRRPEVDTWWIWQFNFRARVDGIDGAADLNIMQGAPDSGQK